MGMKIETTKGITLIPTHSLRYVVRDTEAGTVRVLQQGFQQADRWRMVWIDVPTVPEEISQ